MTTPSSKRRWHYPTPAWLVYASLLVTAVLFFSERWRWFAFNEHKGWTVLIVVAAVGVVLLLMLAWFVAALVFRGRFQFGIRTLLVLTVAVALPFSWLGVEMKNAREQREAAELFLASGCWVYGNDVTGDDVTDEEGAPDYGKWAANLAQLPAHGPLVELLGKAFFYDATVVVLYKPDGNPSNRKFYKRDVAQALLLALKNLPELRALDLSGMPVNDSDLEYVVPMKELRYLDLAHTTITDAGVTRIQKALPNCQIIR